MKQNDLNDITYQLAPQNYENIFSVFTDDDNNYYYNLLRTINFPVNLDPNSYTQYIVLTNDTWPLIAWKQYRDVRLWWVICAANQITNPLDLPVPGTSVKIINALVLRSLLNTIIQD